MHPTRSCYLRVLGSSRRAPPREARVERAFAHRVAAAEPGEEAFETKTVAAVGGGAVSRMEKEELVGR